MLHAACPQESAAGSSAGVGWHGTGLSTRSIYSRNEVVLVPCRGGSETRGDLGQEHLPAWTSDTEITSEVLAM